MLVNLKKKLDTKFKKQNKIILNENTEILAVKRLELVQKIDCENWDNVENSFPKF